MSRETDAQRGMLEQQLEHDRHMRNIERLHDLLSQGAKGLSVLNGGAVVAMLAFVQALLDKPVYQCFKPYAIGSLAVFLVGAFLPAISFFFHHNSISQAHKGIDVQIFLRGLYSANGSVLKDYNRVTYKTTNRELH